MHDQFSFDVGNERELRASLVNNWEILIQTKRLQPFFKGLYRRYLDMFWQ